LRWLRSAKARKNDEDGIIKFAIFNAFKTRKSQFLKVTTTTTIQMTLFLLLLLAAGRPGDTGLE